MPHFTRKKKNQGYPNKTSFLVFYFSSIYVKSNVLIVMWQKKEL